MAQPKATATSKKASAKMPPAAMQPDPNTRITRKRAASVSQNVPVVPEEDERPSKRARRAISEGPELLSSSPSSIGTIPDQLNATFHPQLTSPSPQKDTLPTYGNASPKISLDAAKSYHAEDKLFSSASISSELEDLKRRLAQSEAARVDNRRLRATIVERDAHISGLSAQVESAEHSRIELQSAHEQELKKLKAKHAAEIRKLKKELQTVNGSNKKLAEDLAEEEQKNTRLEELVVEPNQDQETLRAEIKGLTDRCTTLTNSQQKVIQAFNGLQRAVGEWHISCSGISEAWLRINAYVRSVADNVILVDTGVYSAAELPAQAPAFVSFAEKLSSSWSTLYDHDDSRYALITGVIWRYLSERVFERPLELWGKKKYQTITDILRKVDTTEDAGLKKVRYARAMIGQFHVDTPQLRLPPRVQAKLATGLASLFNSIMRPAPSDHNIHSTINESSGMIVERSLNLAKDMVQSASPLEILWSPADRSMAEPLDFDGVWMGKVQPNISSNKGVDLIMTPGVAAYGHPRGEGLRERLVVFKALVLADSTVGFERW
ncbi:uncharacterized protein B0I36DRAFT_361866 [Microdochium trichocladiopsis]|uniref:Uncharacterized protein n=1 Tax=Microdochium trichocladiopsis TaxID=1682393 RepID=A0A9P8YBN8_9PEZI|nr:uncharacterized protein B0I36DRAFT_361866 [Microdochium trichocladiopsis]KAH7033158.1 hypothetical protein B0I36DRAFT_361866 [Microdochium trichocladiopsis]